MISTPTLVHDSGAPALAIEHIRADGGEPRVHDLKLAEMLGYEKPHNLRNLIDRNLPELRSHGTISATAAKNNDAKGRGRPGLEYWLNEGQALVLCALARTDAAAAVRKQMIDVFMAYRRAHNMPDGDKTFGSLPDEIPEIAAFAEMQRTLLQLVETCARLDAAPARSPVADIPAPALESIVLILKAMADKVDRLEAASAAVTAPGVAAAPVLLLPAPTKQAAPTAELLCGVIAIAKFIGIPYKAALHQIETGRLPTFRLGRNICARRADLTKWMEAKARTAGAMPEAAKADACAPESGCLIGRDRIAAYMGISDGDLMCLMNVEKFPAFSLGGFISVRVEALAEWIAGRESRR